MSNLLLLFRKKRSGDTSSAVSDEFSPLSLSPLLWLRSDSINGVADLGQISQWNDLSGNGNHCTQSTAGNRPIYSSGGIGGFPEVALTYVDLGIGTVKRWMIIPNGVAINQNNCTLIMVGRPISKALLAGYGVPISIGGLKFGYSPTTIAIVNTNGLTTPSERVYHQPHMLAYVSSSTGVSVWYDDLLQSVDAAASDEVAGGFLGGDATIAEEGSGYPFYGALSEVLIFNRSLSSTEIDTVYDYLKNRYFVGSYTKQVICDGNSLTTGYSCVGHGNYPGMLYTKLGGLYRLYVTSIAGNTTAQLTTAASTDVDPLYSAAFDKNIVVIWEGLLDVYNGSTPAQAITNLGTFCSGRKSAGFDVVVVTCLASNYISNADRATLNTGIRNNYVGWGVALADIAANELIGGDESNHDAAYFNDSDGNLTHMTSAGFNIVAEIVKDAILTL